MFSKGSKASQILFYQQKRAVWKFALFYYNSGRDFATDESIDVPTQVDQLIKQATSHENLCQCYIGWYVYNEFIHALY